MMLGITISGPGRGSTCSRGTGPCGILQHHLLLFVVWLQAMSFKLGASLQVAGCYKVAQVVWLQGRRPENIVEGCGANGVDFNGPDPNDRAVSQAK